MNKSKLLGALAGATLSLGAAGVQAEPIDIKPIVQIPIVVTPVLPPIFQIPIDLGGPGYFPKGVPPVVTIPTLPIIAH